MRLLTHHNLTFIAAVMSELREAILQGCLSEVTKALRGGATPRFSQTAGGVQ
jgi:queuine/archaeosine tRNA-ribosyltransferase